jgi:hypothetical protein
MKLTEALKQYQYDEAYPVPFSFIPDRLLNKEYCDDLAKRLLENCTGKWERYTATPKLGNMLPDSPGIYMFVWKPFFPFEFDDKTQYIRLILYIGKAGGDNEQGTIKKRYKSEYSKIVQSDAEKIWKSKAFDTRKERLEKCLNLHDLEYWFIVADSCHELSKIGYYETHLIKLFNPPVNRIGVRVKTGASVPAF